MGVSRHDRRLIGFGLVAENRFQRQQVSDNGADFPADVHPEINGHLVVTAPGGVQTFPGVADTLRQQGLDIHVNVLMLGGELDIPRLDIGEDFAQAPLNRLPVLRGENAAIREHFGVGHTAPDVLTVKASVEVNGRVERVDQRVRVLAEAPGP